VEVNSKKTNPHEIPLPPQPFISRQDVARMLGTSQRSVDHLIQAGRLPRPLRLNRRVVRWPSGLIVGHLNQLVAEAVSTVP
jgi:predicted DNA-binding transcriptional regulator AlpA